MELVLVGVILEALFGAGVTAGVSRLAKRSASARSDKALKEVEAKVRSVALSSLASLDAELSRSETDLVMAFLRTVLGRRIIRLFFGTVVHSRTLPSSQALGHQLEAGLRLTADVSPDTARKAAILLSVTLRKCGAYVLEIVSSDPSVRERILTRPSLQDYSSHDAFTAAEDTLLSLLSVDLTAVHLYVDKLRNLVRRDTKNVPSPYQSRGELPYEEIYVAPRLALRRPSRQDGSVASTYERVSSPREFLRSSHRAVVLGDPGAGKSTLVTYLAHIIYESESLENRVIPFIVRIREYDAARRLKSLSVCEYVADRMNELYQLKAPRSAVECVCMTGQALVLFDGLDELADASRKKELVTIITSFCRLYSDARVIVTSRHVGYEDAPLDTAEFATWDLTPFSEDEVEEYVRKWFGGDPDLDNVSRAAVISSFLLESRDISDIRSNPLMLNLLCNVYLEYGSIPRNRAELYEKCAQMLFDQWDSKRRIIRDNILRADVRGALHDVALWMYEANPKDGVGRRSLVSRVTDYLKPRFDDSTSARIAAEDLVASWEGRAWVLTDVGIVNRERRYDFTHRTFLEYFAAGELVRISDTVEDLADVMLSKLPSTGWDVIGEIAFQIFNQDQRDGSDKLCACILGSRHFPVSSQLHVLGFLCKHLDTLGLSRESMRSVIHSAVRVYLEYQPAATLGMDFQSMLGSMPPELVPGSQVQSWKSKSGHLGVLPLLMLLNNRADDLGKWIIDAIIDAIIGMSNEDNRTLASYALLALLNPSQPERLARSGGIMGVGLTRQLGATLSKRLQMSDHWHQDLGARCAELASINPWLAVVTHNRGLISTSVAARGANWIVPFIALEPDDLVDSEGWQPDERRLALRKHLLRILGLLDGSQRRAAPGDVRSAISSLSDLGRFWTDASVDAARIHPSIMGGGCQLGEIIKNIRPRGLQMDRATGCARLSLDCMLGIELVLMVSLESDMANRALDPIGWCRSYIFVMGTDPPDDMCYRREDLARLAPFDQLLLGRMTERKTDIGLILDSNIVAERWMMGDVSFVRWAT